MDEPNEVTEPVTVNDPLEDDALREDAETPETEDGGPDDDAEPDEPDDDERTRELVDAAQEYAIQSERDLQQRHKRLDAEKQRHAKRLGEIMGGDAEDLIPCPVCMDGIDGYVFAPDVQQLPDDAILRLRQLIGLSGLEGLLPATFAERCPDCDGQGEVKTGSRVAGFETATCERCNKSGWVRKGQPLRNGHVDLPAPGEPEPIITGPTVYEDPEIQHLRERGFTVIPPMSVKV